VVAGLWPNKEQVKGQRKRLVFNMGQHAIGLSFRNSGFFYRVGQSAVAAHSLLLIPTERIIPAGLFLRNSACLLKLDTNETPVFLMYSNNWAGADILPSSKVSCQGSLATGRQWPEKGPG
jgi:hypothetical protein